MKIKAKFKWVQFDGNKTWHYATTYPGWIRTFCGCNVSKSKHAITKDNKPDNICKKCIKTTEFKDYINTGNLSTIDTDILDICKLTLKDNGKYNPLIR